MSNQFALWQLQLRQQQRLEQFRNRSQYQQHGVPPRNLPFGAGLGRSLGPSMFPPPALNSYALQLAQQQQPILQQQQQQQFALQQQNMSQQQQNQRWDVFANDGGQQEPDQLLVQQHQQQQQRNHELRLEIERLTRESQQLSSQQEHSNDDGGQQNLQLMQQQQQRQTCSPRQPRKKCRHCERESLPHKDRRLLCRQHRWQRTMNNSKIEMARRDMETNAGVICVRKKIMKTSEERGKQCATLRAMKVLQDGSYKPKNEHKNFEKLPNHQFGNIQFHNEQVLQAMMEGNDNKLKRHSKTDQSQIDVLGDGKAGLLVDQSIPYHVHSFIAEIAEDSRNRILEHRDPNLRDELLQIALDARIKLPVPGDEKAPALFNAGEYHRGEFSEEIQYFQHHRDKNFFSMVSIYVVEGESFNFVIVPGGPDKGPDFDTEHGDYGEYVKWKEGLGEEDLKNVKLYEDALKDNTRSNKWYTKGHHSIVVYKLTPGQRLIFGASWLTHGVIVPGKQQRSVIVFHDLLPKWTTFSFVKKPKSSTAKKGPDDATVAPAGEGSGVDVDQEESGLAHNPPQLRSAKGGSAKIPTKQQTAGQTSQAAAKKGGSGKRKSASEINTSEGAAKKGCDVPPKGKLASRAPARARSTRVAAKKKEAMTTSSAASSGNKAKRSRKRKY
ncbi:expressed unknown protein [Seminavis robusta]|uniref:Uncharacterized protein n=1 Tax=Seminavis robusta TaxID=568900 RepID=A0A9N8ELU7_9STRA|nr:expressed unknown protein [Seminavis robusta]|eukprot:Sro1144_g246050.1 n/a (666) ;mRNA; r:2759-4756